MFDKSMTEATEKIDKIPQSKRIIFYAVRILAAVVTFFILGWPSMDSYITFVSDEFLGNMNESLYLSMNLNTDTLDNEEDNSGTSVLSREMDNVTKELKELKELEKLDVSDLESNEGTGHSDINHSGGGEITGSGTSGSETVIEAPAGLGIEVPTGKTEVNIPGSGSVSGGESGKGGAAPKKKNDAEAVLEEDLGVESEAGETEQSEENLDQVQPEEAQEDQQQLAESEAVAEGQPAEDEEKQLTEEEKRRKEQAQV